MALVLIIDDDELITRALFDHLRQSGVTADLALNPAEAETLLSVNEYALVIMDAYLTGQLSIRALELFDRVRTRGPDTHLLLLTAYGSEALSNRVKHDARITVLAKPQPIPYLTEVIHGLLNQYQSFPDRPRGTTVSG
jgi:DNA-binding NtrC family response regulator